MFAGFTDEGLTERSYLIACQFLHGQMQVS